MAMALYHRKQAAMMAPTSILAEQHYRGISRLLEQMPGDWKPVVALLTGSLTTSEREAIYRGMADGSIDLVIGTHALIQPGVEFKDLAIAIIDEQHRFGVEQRAALRGKGINPHLLVMTATPIPRTLALTLYADLDLSIIDEKPPGRQPVQTRILLPVARERAMGFIEAHLKEGRQAFVVHPLVEASDRIDARSAVEAYEELSKVFYRYRVCLLHGRMSAAEKDEIMAAFSRHEYDVMVTTSVAEVGVDIPNASVILIEGANRFGLSQLHQFRGRVGRGEHQSFCLLLSDNPSREAEERLRAMEKTDDGFELAEMDWKIRGAGELLGLRQSGGQSLPLPEFITPELVELAQQEARTIYEEDPFLQQEEHLLLAASVRNLLAQAGGDMS
jgi:ATP-dependent DNA helicase RecG